MVVDWTWRSPDRRWLVDEVVDEPGLGYGCGMPKAHPSPRPSTTTSYAAYSTTWT
jgi:hypothetical protein